jgi:hypothetical protein
VAGSVAVRGLRDVQRGLKDAEKEVRLGFRKELRAVAQPVADDAAIRAASSIRRIGPDWFKMRVGVTQTSVYVAPRERGVAPRSGARRQTDKRPNLAPLLMDRAMQPALDAHGAQAEKAIEQALDRMCDRFNRGF